MRVGLLGGSFNPAHAGHLHVAREALRRLRLDQVWLMVSPGNPLKPQAAWPRSPSASPRRGGSPTAGGSWRPRSSAGSARRFTVDTLRLLRRRFPAAKFVWLMGADNLAQLPRWRRLAEHRGRRALCGDAAPLLHYARRRGRAATVLRHARLPARDAHGLAGRAPPAWVFLPAARTPPRPPRSARNIPRSWFPIARKPPTPPEPPAEAPRPSRPTRARAPARAPASGGRMALAAPPKPGTPRKKAAAAGPATPPAEPRPQVEARAARPAADGHRGQPRGRQGREVVTLDLAGRASFTDRMVIATGLADRQIAAMATHLEEQAARGRAAADPDGGRRRVGLGADRRGRHRHPPVQARGARRLCAGKDVGDASWTRRREPSPPPPQRCIGTTETLLNALPPVPRVIVDQMR